MSGNVAYRLRVYAPRSVDPTEATILTPAAGAPHTDAFQVATIMGVAGYQPYLDPPRGRNGRIDPLDRKLDIGEWTFPLIDKRVNDTTPVGLKRWLTAFLGNVKGQPRFAGLRFEADESVDNGATWTRWRTGRIASVSVGAVTASLSCRDITDEAKMAVFVGAPHASMSYVARQAVCPIGLMGSDYGTIKAVAPLKGTARNVTVNAIGQLTTTYTAVTIDPSVTRPENIVTRQLANAAAPNDYVFVPSTVLGGDTTNAVLPNFSGPLRATVKHTSGALNGQTGDYKAAGLSFVTGSNGKLRLGSVALAILDANDVNQLAVPANGVTVEIALWVDAPVSKTNPLFINDVFFPMLLQDLCDGKFGYLYRTPESLPSGKAYGDPKRTLGTSGMRAPLTSGMLSHSGLTAFTAANCVDGKHTTQGWDTDSAVSGAWLKVDLGSGNARTVTHARVYVEAAPYAGIYDVEYSDNDSSWTKAAVGFAPSKTGWNAIAWGEVGAHRYWRLLLTNTPGAGSFLNELELFEGPHGPPMRFIVKSRDELISWVEKNGLKPLNVALYANEQAQLTLVDLRIPSSLAGVPTLTEADLARDKPQGEWSFDRENVITRVEFTRYSDRQVKPEEIESSDGALPEMPPGGVESFDHPLITIDVGATDVGDKAYEVDAPGFRSMDGETLGEQSRAVYLENYLLALANQWRRPFGWGLIDLPVTLRRGGAAVTPGGLALATFKHVPDPTTWQRGGTRLCRVLEMSPQGAERSVLLLDLGNNTIADAPSLGVPAQETGNTYTGVTSVLTLNAAGQPAEVRYAVTDTGVSTVPVDASPLWTVVGRFTAAQTVTIRKLPMNRRIWIQGRTLPDYLDGQQPSAWTNASSPGRVDTATLPAPSSPAVSSQTSRSFTVTWTNGAADLVTELLIATPTSEPRVVVARVMPGSTLYKFPGDTGLVLSPSTTYRVGVRHVLAKGFISFGASAEVTVDATTNSTDPFIQPPIRLREFV